MTDTLLPPQADTTADTAATDIDTAADTETVIAANRRRIDDLDARIIALVQERQSLSRAIQSERIGSGGRRVSLNREMEVLTHYSEQLGRPGTALAMTLLELCRGRV